MPSLRDNDKIGRSGGQHILIVSLDTLNSHPLELLHIYKYINNKFRESMPINAKKAVPQLEGSFPFVFACGDMGVVINKIDKDQICRDIV